MVRRNILVFVLIFLFVNVTPAVAVNIHDFDEDMQTIKEWNEGSAWHKVWYFIDFCQAVHHIASRTNELKDIGEEYKAQAESRVAQIDNATLERQKTLDRELDTYFKQKNSGNNNFTVPQIALEDAYETQMRVSNEIERNIVVDQVSEPKVNDIVQLAGKIGDDEYAKFTLHYWLFKGVFIDNATKEKQVKLYNGNKDVNVPLDKFKTIFTGVVLKVPNLNQLTMDNIESNSTSNHLNEITTSSLLQEIVIKIYAVKINKINKKIDELNKETHLCVQIFYIGYLLLAIGCVLLGISGFLVSCVGISYILLKIGLGILLIGVSAMYISVLIRFHFGAEVDMLTILKNHLENRDIKLASC